MEENEKVTLRTPAIDLANSTWFTQEFYLDTFIEPKRRTSEEKLFIHNMDGLYNGLITAFNADLVDRYTM